MADAGLPNPVVLADTLTSTDPVRPVLPPFTTMAEAATRTGAIGTTEADSWLAQLADAGHRGHFCWAVTMFAVAATRP